MRPFRVAFATAVIAVACSGSLARADELGSVRFTVPSGFEVYKRTATGVDMRGPNDAVISIRINLAGADAIAVARDVLPSDGKMVEVKEVAIQVAGRAGHLVVRRTNSRMYASAACIPAAGKAIAIVLGAPPETYKGSCTPWGAVVDDARFVEAAAPRPRNTPAPAPAPAPVTNRAPAKHWVELRNVADHGTATVYWDGQSYSLAASSGQKLEVTAGLHSFKWQNADGSWGENRFEVPKFNVFKGSCPRPAAPAPRVEEQPRAPEAALSEEEYKEGARWFMNLACFAIYTVKTMDDWSFKPEDIHKDSMIEPYVKDMKARPEFRKFCLSIPGFWKELCDKYATGDADMKYQIRRDAAIFLRANAANAYPIPEDDGLGGDEIDRLLRKERQAWDNIRAQRKQAETTRAMTSQMMSNWIFNNTSNAMTFTPVRW